MTTLESKLVVSVSDRTGSGASAAAKNLSAVDKAIKSVGAAKSKGLEEIRNQLAAIGKHKDAEKRLAEFAAANEKARARVRALGADLMAATKPTAAMGRAYDAAARAADAAGQRLARQQTTVAASARALQAMGVATGAVAQAEARLASEADRAAAAIQKETAAAAKSASRRAALAREIVRQANEEAAANRRAAEASRARWDAAKMVMGGGAAYAGMKAKQEIKDIATRAVDLDLAQRQQVAFGNIAEGDQKGTLRPQADRIAQATRFTIPDIITGQTRILESLPSTFSGETRAAIAKAVTENAVNYALAIPGGIDMETAGHTVIAYLKSLNKDISTPEKAAKESAAAVNTMVKASKLSGLAHNDIAEFLKFGGAPGTFAGFSDPFKFAVLAAQKRAGTDGALSGTFMRALAGYSVAPTTKGLGALADIGINYDSFAKNRKPASGENFARGLMQRYGIKLSKDQMTRISEVMQGTYTNEFGDEAPIMSSREKFIEEVMPIVEESLGRTKKGKPLAVDKAKVTKDLNAYFNSTTGDVDVEGLFREIVKKDPSMQVLNAFLGKQQGGRMIALLQQMKYFESDLQQLGHVDPDFAKKIGEYLTGGLYGSQQNAQGSVETAKTRIGEAYEAPLKYFFDRVGDAGDWLANLSVNGRIAAGAMLALAAAGGHVVAFLTLRAGLAAMLGGITGARGAGAAAGAAGGLGLRGLLGMGLRGAGALGLGALGAYGLVKGAGALGYGKREMTLDESLARLRSQGKAWSPALQEKMFDDYLSPGGERRLKQMDDNEMARRKGVMGGTRPEAIIPGGADAGSAAGAGIGQGIADGLGKQSGLVRGVAEQIMAEIRSVLSQGVDVPVRLNKSASSVRDEIRQELRTTYADTGVSFS